MLLEQRNLQKRTLNALNKKKLYTTDDILRFIPYKYHDYSRIMPLGDALDKDCAISGYVESIGKNERKIEASIIEETSGEKLNVFWFGHAYRRKWF